MWRLPTALILALAAWASASTAGAILSQEQRATAVEIGAGPIREPSLALVGRAIYSGDTVSVFGYFTALEGLDPALLFTAPGPPEASARFTYAGEIALASHASRGDTTSTSGQGLIRVYFDDAAGGSWDDPASFAGGQELAEWNVVLQETLQRQGPGTGLVVGDNRLTQSASQQFTLNGDTYRFGAVGIVQRLRTVGALIAVDEAKSAYTVSLTGTAAVSERPLTPVQLGLPATPAATPGMQATTCPALEQWLSETMSRLARAKELAAGSSVAGGIDDIDAAAASAAADELASLATAQRTAEAPPGGEDGNRLAVTALSTYARGMKSVSDGASSRDAGMVVQGQSVIADGQRLADRAVQTMYGVGAACPVAG